MVPMDEEFHFATFDVRLVFVGCLLLALEAETVSTLGVSHLKV